METKKTTLSQVADHTAKDMALTQSALSANDYGHMERIAVCDDMDILDGYHRCAGLVAWAISSDLALEDVEILVDVYTDSDMIDTLLDMGPGEDRGEALAELI